MKNTNSWKNAFTGAVSLLMAAMTTWTPAATQTVVVPLHGVTPVLTPVTINNSAGDQFDPHISGNWVSYTSDAGLRYYNFATGIDAPIPMGPSSNDLLSDISGSKIVFSRVITGVKTAVMVFDAATPAAAPIEIEPAASTTRIGGAIGGNTVAYIDYGFQSNGEVVIHDLTSSVSTRITNDTEVDWNPNVSPDGNVVVWEHCPTSLSNCDIWRAVKSGSAWSVSVVANSSSPEGNPDTNGTLVVYDSRRGSNPEGIFWRAAGGGEFQLLLTGWAYNPSIAGNFIAFESRATQFVNGDIFVYDIAANKLYQITDTSSVDEHLNNITQLPNGDLRVVWSSDEDGIDSRNVKGATFSLPSATPSPTDLLQQLIDAVAALNLSHGIANSLDAKLENANAALLAARSGDASSACGILGAFISEVQAQSGKALTSQEATQLINLANQVRAGLGCA